MCALSLLFMGCPANTDPADGDGMNGPPAFQPLTGGMGGIDATGGTGGTGGIGATGGIGGIAGTMSLLPVDSGAPDTGLADAEVDAASQDLATYASGLHELFIDVPCPAGTPVPLADQATCDHPAGTQHIERPVTFGGDPNTTYAVTLRVRGIWEPTSIQDGQAPLDGLPFQIGGTIAPGNPIDYQQYAIVVSDPAETYWLNDHGYTAHDIHKLDYEATLQVAGGATVTVIMNDGNERQIANWTEDYFADLTSAASTGQMLRLDVVSVTDHP